MRAVGTGEDALCDGLLVVGGEGLLVRGAGVEAMVGEGEDLVLVEVGFFDELGRGGDPACDAAHGLSALALSDSDSLADLVGGEALDDLRGEDLDVSWVDVA